MSIVPPARSIRVGADETMRTAEIIAARKTPRTERHAAADRALLHVDHERHADSALRVDRPHVVDVPRGDVEAAARQRRTRNRRETRRAAAPSIQARERRRVRSCESADPPGGTRAPPT